MPTLFSTVDSSRVITASIDAGNTAALGDYWSDIPDSASRSRLSSAVSIDAAQLTSVGLPDAVPMLVFVNPLGQVTDVVTGSVLSWTPTTLRKMLTIAGMRTF